MRWLVDGYNVIRRDPDPRGAEEGGLESGRRALLALVAAAARGGRDRFPVIFDGAPNHGRPAAGGQVETLFSRPPDNADDVLVRLARQGREGAVVVTSDRAVADAARRAGCPVVRAEDFVSALTSSDGGVADDGEAERDGDRDTRRGNPRRLSRDERASRRALDRLRGR
jgi:predicted RNA-binding protein with PIN domain